MKKSSLNRHLQSMGVDLDEDPTSPATESQQKETSSLTYQCFPCKYTTSRKDNWKKHLLTNKHKKLEDEALMKDLEETVKLFQPLIKPTEQQRLQNETIQEATKRPGQKTFPWLQQQDDRAFAQMKERQEKKREKKRLKNSQEALKKLEERRTQLMKEIQKMDQTKQQKKEKKRKRKEEREAKKLKKETAKKMKKTLEEPIFLDMPDLPELLSPLPDTPKRANETPNEEIPNEEIQQPEEEVKRLNKLIDTNPWTVYDQVMNHYTLEQLTTMKSVLGLDPRKDLDIMAERMIEDKAQQDQNLSEKNTLMDTAADSPQDEPSLQEEQPHMETPEVSPEPVPDTCQEISEIQEELHQTIPHYLLTAQQDQEKPEWNTIPNYLQNQNWNTTFRCDYCEKTSSPDIQLEPTTKKPSPEQPRKKMSQDPSKPSRKRSRQNPPGASKKTKKNPQEMTQELPGWITIDQIGNTQMDPETTHWLNQQSIS